MNEKEYEYAKGRLEGLREATDYIESSGYFCDHDMQVLEAKIQQLETQLSGTTVFDETAMLKAENEKLKEQLAKAIVPKYQVGQEVYVLLNDEDGVLYVEKTKVLGLRIGCNDLVGNYTYYEVEAFNGYEFEKDLFATEVDALNSLEGKDE